MKISAYAAQVDDELMRDAIALQGAEELRHAALLSTLVARYGIQVAKRPSARLPNDPEQAFVDIGYGECIDSFFAFGFFEVARQSGFCPQSLLEVVAPILDEEARHIVFFVNWEAYQLYQRGRGWATWRALRALRYYGRAVRRRLGAFRNGDGEGFTMSGSGSVTVDLTPKTFLRHCLHENDRRLSVVERDLLRPWLVPALSGLALRGLSLIPRRS